MTLKLYNTLTKKKEKFKPLNGNQVKIYSCGPTVYTNAHIGNFRTFVFVDFLKRYLQYRGYEVYHVMNITDVDDKIIQQCSLKGKTREELAEKYTETFFRDMKSLNLIPASLSPIATDHIKEMQKLIKQLIKRKYAYQTEDGSVFFKLSEFSTYGRLSRIDRAGLSQTERVLNDEYGKESIHDFALWKAWKEEDGDIGWDSPWGRGRPGWHIECSAMSMLYLGEDFDIHTGGVDLIFPHHENEIAQSVCATGSGFARYWIHCEHLLVDGSKMSKSAGNYYTLRDLINRGFSLAAIRYLLLATHYRQKVNLTFDGLRAATNAVSRLQELRRRLQMTVNDSSTTPLRSPEMDFRNALDNDLNISVGLAVLFNWLRELNRKLDTNTISREAVQVALAFLHGIDSVLGVIEGDELKLSEEDLELIEEREAARRSKNWSRADEIREYFLGKGIVLEDTPKGTIAVPLSPEIGS
ncbi:MAG: cysteine--tRNA ligase [Fidelibacterota bacterium]